MTKADVIRNMSDSELCDIFLTSYYIMRYVRNTNGDLPKDIPQYPEDHPLKIKVMKWIQQS